MHSITAMPAEPNAPAIKRTFRLLLYDALASEAMSTLATGVFLTGFAVALGASNLEIGILAAVPSAVQFLQFPAVVLVERLRRRRAICVWAAGIGRAFLIAASAAPLLGGSVGVIVLIASIAIWQASAAVAGCAWNSWMRDLVPEALVRALLWPPRRGEHGGRNDARATERHFDRSLEAIHAKPCNRRLYGALPAQRRDRLSGGLASIHHT